MPVTSMTPQSLAARIGTPDAPRIIDVRIAQDVAADPRLIPTARRCPHDQIAAHASALQGREVVIACQKGLKLSQGAAAILRAEGLQAHHLTGGTLAWAKAGLPTLPAETKPETETFPPTHWVRGEISAHTTLATWLVTRFLDPNARILDTDPDQTTAVAERFAATPLPDPGAIAAQIPFPGLAQTMDDAPALLDTLWSGLTETTATTLLDALFASRKPAQ